MNKLPIWGNKCLFRHFIASLAYMSRRSIWNNNCHPLSTPDMRLKIGITVTNFTSGVLYLIQMYYLICNLAYNMVPCFLNFLYAYDCFRFWPQRMAEHNVTYKKQLT
jgi:hypothetical protein